jgi:hypothetical protein
MPANGDFQLGGYLLQKNLFSKPAGEYSLVAFAFVFQRQAAFLVKEKKRLVRDR